LSKNLLFNRSNFASKISENHVAEISAESFFDRQGKNSWNFVYYRIPEKQATPVSNFWKMSQKSKNNSRKIKILQNRLQFWWQTHFESICHPQLNIKIFENLKNHICGFFLWVTCFLETDFFQDFSYHQDLLSQQF